MKKSIKHIALLFIVFSFAITGCKKDKDVPEPEKPKATFSNIEIGSGNNEIGIISRDFHFNADITAREKIETVVVKILPRNGETYSKDWSHEIVWEEFKGAKNTTVHKHFTIPEDAAAGTYDFVIVVNEQNGSVTEEKRTIKTILPADLPVDPFLSIGLMRTKPTFKVLYSDDHFMNEGDNVLKKGDALTSALVATEVKGNGQFVSFFVNKKHNLHPEAIKNVDFSKVIVIDNAEHTDWEFSKNFSSTKKIIIGAELDNHSTPQATEGNRAWETGDYYWVVLYHNSTYNVNMYEYIDIKIDMSE